jgi:CheY-like chemotaxis protein
VAALSRILIVEDNADVRLFLSDLLTDAGYAVTTADDGQDAFELLEQGLRPRLMMVDLMLPRLSGWDLLAHAQDDPELRYVPKVVITAVPRANVRVVADAVFTKPFRTADVLATVKSLIDRAARSTR